MVKNRKKTDFRKNMTIEEASEFWNEHSLLELEGTEKVDIKFNLKKKQYMGIDREMFMEIEVQARGEKVSPEAFLESWIAEKIS